MLARQKQAAAVSDGRQIFIYIQISEQPPPGEGNKKNTEKHLTFKKSNVFNQTFIYMQISEPAWESYKKRKKGNVATFFSFFNQIFI